MLAAIADNIQCAAPTSSIGKPHQPNNQFWFAHNINPLL
jgi:hypothetical protein